MEKIKNHPSPLLEDAYLGQALYLHQRDGLNPTIRLNLIGTSRMSAASDCLTLPAIQRKVPTMGAQLMN
jgi:hypothetical protein